VTLGWRAGEADEALQVDIYLESLLAAHDRLPRPVAAALIVDDLEPSERRAANLLAENLLRFHPSFRFEEALAARLRAMADRASSGVPGSAPVLPFPIAEVPEQVSTMTAIERERLAASERRRVLIGGAIASGVSLAGAALVAWRATTPPRTAFGRATRAAHRNRSSLRGRA
jgi:hypothetical protein